MLNLEQLLKAHGHEVAVFAMDYSENLETPWKKYFPQNMSTQMAFTRPFGSNEVKTKFKKLLNDFKPDVVHLNDVTKLPEFSPKTQIKEDYYVYLGRVNEVKGVRTLCKAAAQLDKKLIVIGGGELLPELIVEGSKSVTATVPNGMTFTSGEVEDLKDKILKMFAHDFDYQAIAKDAIERYSSEAYYHKLMEYYK